MKRYISINRNNIIFLMISCTCFNFNISNSSAQIKTIDNNSIKEDVEYLINSINTYYPNSATTIKKEISNNLNQYISNLKEPIDRRDFHMEIAKNMAQLNDGHSGTYFIPIDTNYKIPSIDLYYLENKLIYRDHRDSTVYEVMEYNHQKADDVLKKTFSYFCGEREGLIFSCLKNNFVLNYYIQFANNFKSDSTNLMIKNAQTNSIKQMKIRNFDLGNALYPFTIWKKEPYYFELKPKDNTCILTINALENDSAFNAISDSMFTEIKKLNIKNLIIDLRDCPGGKSYIGDNLLYKISNKPYRQVSKTYFNNNKEVRNLLKPNLNKLNKIKLALGLLPSDGNKLLYVTSKLTKTKPQFNGRVYVLTSNYTFSSAVVFSNAIKDYKIGTIIGEETGGNASSYGPALPIELPNSKIIIQLSFMKQVRPSGTDDHRGVLPDYPASQTIEDFIKGIDTIKEHTLKLINK